MSYEVRCECGKSHAVSAADAGTSLRCACGRTLDVPALHQLRIAAGQQALAPAVQVRSLLLRDELPGTRECACCHRETDHLARVSVVCERVITKTRASPTATLLGCFFFGWIGALLAWLVSRTEPVAQYGEDISFVLPLRVCSVCDHELTTPAALRGALVATPAYAALLERYPNATVSRVG
jgi:hypothetical protein